MFCLLAISGCHNFWHIWTVATLDYGRKVVSEICPSLCFHFGAVWCMPGQTSADRVLLTPNTHVYMNRADSRFAPSQWETPLLCNDVSHWLGASLESVLYEYTWRLFFHNRIRIAKYRWYKPGCNAMQMHVYVYACIYIYIYIYVCISVWIDMPTNVDKIR